MWHIVGGNPDRSGGGLITSMASRFEADREAARLVARGYWNVRVLSDWELHNG
jgi:hypothetical protein